MSYYVYGGVVGTEFQFYLAALRIFRSNLAFFFSSTSSGSGAGAKSQGDITFIHNIQNALAGASNSKRI